MGWHAESQFIYHSIVGTLERRRKKTINERNARKRVEKGEKKVFFSNDKMNFINYFTLLMN